jgi:hypothetical protein
MSSDAEAICEGIDGLTGKQNEGSIGWSPPPDRRTYPHTPAILRVGVNGILDPYKDSQQRPSPLPPCSPRSRLDMILILH